jgi:predicted hydrolase (HD superfamily)
MATFADGMFFATIMGAFLFLAFNIFEFIFQKRKRQKKFNKMIEREELLELLDKRYVRRKK